MVRSRNNCFIPRQVVRRWKSSKTSFKVDRPKFKHDDVSIVVCNFVCAGASVYNCRGLLFFSIYKWQGKEAVKAEAYREALKQTPNGFYRRQLYVLEVNLRQQQAMWVNLHHSIFYEVRRFVSMVSKWLFICHTSLLMFSPHSAVQVHIVLHNLLLDTSGNGQHSLRPSKHCTAALSMHVKGPCISAHHN